MMLTRFFGWVGVRDMDIGVTYWWMGTDFLFLFLLRAFCSVNAKKKSWFVVVEEGGKKIQ